MSYILDALRKAEQERGNKSPTSPESKKILKSPKRDKLMLLILAVSVMLLCASTVIIALLMLNTPQRTDGVRTIQPSLPGLSAEQPVPKDTNNYSNVPNLANLSDQFRSTLPNLKVNAHVHAATNPKTSFVILAGERLRNSETSKTGVTVVLIDKDALVLRYADTLFKLYVEY